MKVIGINGSPRKNKNSATMLDYALNGAASTGAETKRIDLFDLHFSGCRSCFACKRLHGESFGRCALQDDLTKVLEEIFDADALIISTPVYFMDVPGAVRSLLERLWFPGLTYSADRSIAYTKRIKVGLIYTMNVENAAQFQNLYQLHRNMFQWFWGEVSVICATNTLQFDDYTKYASSQFNEAEKRAHHERVFPEDCQKAFDMGKGLLQQ